MASRAIAREVGVMTGIAGIWRKCLAAAGIDGLRDNPRPGAKRVYSDATDKRILAMLDQPGAQGAGAGTASSSPRSDDDVTFPV
jgi:transposase